jgi:hypothetical protein
MDKLLWIIVTIVLIILIFSLFNEFRIKYDNRQLINENFVSPKGISFCPFNSKEFIDKKGNSLCCDGKVEDNICYSNIICTLSTPGQYKSCAVIYNKYINDQKVNMCPKGWNYYENGNNKGCVKGAVSEDKRQPIGSGQKCVVYRTEEDNYKKDDSCLNIRDLESFKCLKPNDCRKYVDTDGLLYQSYKNDNITKICADNKRAKAILNEDNYNKLKKENQIC